ncbi:peptidase domain-containing ABC transporter [Magnetospirillum moscoviense]|uniref:Type I secretion system ATPase n=1 Tax=Magnetospirillum moscoviense TaxID=1437059 RepID=A0A178N1P9_9PROT|nr:ATP-binding cassette domain-containing protein [Magnetospirillum moscoviense]MBF0323571.1 ATP-binding cassette domain-containing protein [Alphaproteobacteria bacterium]OAN64504.1 type I secretion system ATPase [Magnetospirillum moscoviense]
MSDAPSKNAWLIDIIEPLRPVVREMLTTSAFINILALAVPIFVMQVYDRVIGHSALETLKGMVIGVFLVLAFDYILRQSRGRVMQTVALRIDVEIGTRLFDKLIRLPLRTLESRPGSYWQQLFRDVDTIRNTLSGGTAVLMADLPYVLIFLVVIFMIGKPLAMVFLAMFVAFVVLAWRSGKSLAESSQREKNVTQSRDALVAEIIAGRSTVKAVSLDRALRPLWEERQAGAIEHSIERGAIGDGYVNLGTGLTTLASAALTSVGAVFIINQELSMGALVACNMLSSRLYGPINQLVGAWRTFGSFRQSVDRLSAVFSEAEERTTSAIRRERPKGLLTVEQVTFAYDEKAKEPTLEIERLQILPGGITAILGRNGCGKTTLLKLLLGLYSPSRGRILLDESDIAQFTRAELAGWMGYVPQETLLFATTVRDNIAYGAPGADDDAILDAAKAAGVHQAIADLPEGYATQIGEAGSRLSAGQRQRIAIARALVGNPPVLVLDEPSASLDRQAEEALRATLMELAKERTIIIVTHSPVLLPACRDVVVIDRGHLAAAGPAAKVLPEILGARPRTQAPGTPGAAAPSAPMPAMPPQLQGSVTP